MGDLQFGYATITTRGRRTEHRSAVEESLAGLTQARRYALFAPQFGLGSNQLIALTAWSDPALAGVEVVAALSAIDGVEAVAAWEASRQLDADPAARSNFRRRGGLTTRTWAITTTPR